MTLYELTGEYQRIYEALEGATPDEADAILEELTQLEGDITDKAEAYARFMKNKQAEAEAFKAEAERLIAKGRAAENAAERMKDAMLESMKALNIQKITTGIGAWRTQMNPMRCTVTDAKAVPEEWHIKQEDKIDRAGIIKHFNMTGELVDGVEIGQTLGIRFR